MKMRNESKLNTYQVAYCALDTVSLFFIYDIVQKTFRAGARAIWPMVGINLHPMAKDQRTVTDVMDNHLHTEYVHNSTTSIGATLPKLAHKRTQLLPPPNLPPFVPSHNQVVSSAQHFHREAGDEHKKRALSEIELSPEFLAKSVIPETIAAAKLANNVPKEMSGYINMIMNSNAVVRRSLLPEDVKRRKIAQAIQLYTIPPEPPTNDSYVSDISPELLDEIARECLFDDSDII